MFSIEEVHQTALAVNKLRNELGKEHNKFLPTEHILKYLLTKAYEDLAFAQRVILEKKNAKELFEYMLQEVKKALNGQNGWLDNQVVYEMAVTYFTSDEITIEKPEVKEVQIKMAPPLKPTKEVVNEEMNLVIDYNHKKGKKVVENQLSFDLM